MVLIHEIGVRFPVGSRVYEKALAAKARFLLMWSPVAKVERRNVTEWSESRSNEVMSKTTRINAKLRERYVFIYENNRL